MRIERHDGFTYFVFSGSYDAWKWNRLFYFFGCRLVSFGGTDNAWEF